MVTENRRKEEGQSIFIIAMIVVVLLALVALVVDVGNAYAQRRVVQNAVDASCMAGVQVLAENVPAASKWVMQLDVLTAIQDYAEENGLLRDRVQGWFVDAEGARLTVVRPSYELVPENTRGVEVLGHRPFQTYFAHLLGLDDMTASATSTCWVLHGPCSGDNIFPLTMHVNTFGANGPAMNSVYTMWNHADQEAPGNFGWVHWGDKGSATPGCRNEPGGGETGQGPSAVALECNMNSPGRSNMWRVGDWMPGSTGVQESDQVRDELSARILGTDWANRPPTVTIPIYGDYNDAGGSNAAFQIMGFASFRMTCFYKKGQGNNDQMIEIEPGACDACISGEGMVDGNEDKCIQGYFVGWTDVSFDDGCMETGVIAPSFRKPNAGWTPVPQPTATTAPGEPTSAPGEPTNTPVPPTAVPVLQTVHLYSFGTKDKGPDGNNKWKVTIVITVHDKDHALISDVDVAGTVSDGTGNPTAVSCTTGANGECSVTKNGINNSNNLTYTLTGMSGYTYQPSDNHISTSLTVTPP